LQQLNGIFFIPVASIMLAGFFLKGISAIAAKSALFFGLAFYIITTFILKVDVHFVHIWGIEFVLNMAIMYGVSYFFPRKGIVDEQAIEVVDMHGWKHTYLLSTILIIVTVLIYVLLGVTV
jgi:SSS family solute:Na+ symporter